MSEPLAFCTKCPNVTLLKLAYVDEDGMIVCEDCKTENSVKIPDEDVDNSKGD